MTQPGWHPDPEGSGQLRWWDGQQWTSAVQPRPQAQTPPPAPEKTPLTPQQKRRNYILVGVAAVVLVGFVGFNSWRDSRDDEPDTRAVETSERETTTSSAPATTTTRTQTAPPSSTFVPPPVTSAAPPRATPQLSPPAATATEAGCEEADPTMISTIESEITEGRVLRDIAAVTTTVNGLEYQYVSANVYRSDGETRSVSGVVWLSPGLGVVNLSSNSRDVTPGFMFGRGTFGNAGDEAGLQVQECVSALARGR